MSTSEKKDFFTEYENKILSSNNIQVNKDLSWKIWQEISLEKYSLRIFDDTKDSPAIYEKRLEVPAFLRKQQDR